MNSRRLITIGAVLGTLALPAAAVAHLERPSYWPDPAPDTSIKPAAGGKVPELRSLRDRGQRQGRRQGARGLPGQGRLEVAATGRASRSPRRASTATGSGPASRRWASAARRGAQAAAQNGALGAQVQVQRDPAGGQRLRATTTASWSCRAATPSRPRARRRSTTRAARTSPRPTRAAPRRPASATRSPAPTTRTWSTSQGRAVPDTPPPQPPLTNRQGIPDLGPCVRCNLQLEGSGVLAHRRDRRRRVRLHRKGAEARPRKLDKHVVIRADRADGFVVHNLTARGALEHGIYIEETDGYRIDTVKMFWAADYANLTFTSDHGLYTDCDGFGAGDAVLYPGAAPETGEQADKTFYPDAPRINTIVHEVRHARQRARLLGLDGQRRADHQQPHLRQHRRHLDRHDLAGGPPRVPGRRRAGRPQLHLLEQPGPVRSRTRRWSPVVGILPSGVGHLLGRPQQRPRPRQLDLGQLAQRGLPAVDPGLPRHARGQRQPGQLVQGPDARPPRAPTASSATTSAGCRRASSRSRPCYKFGNKVGATRGPRPTGWTSGGTRAASARSCGNCWYDNKGPDGTRPQRHRLRGPATAPTCCRPTAPPARAPATR